MNSNIIDSIAAKERRLIPVTKWTQHHDWPPIGGLRYLIFNADSNGFSSCVCRVGRKVLIDEAKFFEWVDQQNNKHKESFPIVRRA